MSKATSNHSLIFIRENEGQLTGSDCCGKLEGDWLVQNDDFSEWSKKDRGQAWFDLLRAKAHTISKLHIFEKELLAKELQKEINIMKTN